MNEMVSPKRVSGSVPSGQHSARDWAMIFGAENSGRLKLGQIILGLHTYRALYISRDLIVGGLAWLALCSKVCYD